MKLRKFYSFMLLFAALLCGTNVWGEVVSIDTEHPYSMDFNSVTTDAIPENWTKVAGTTYYPCVDNTSVRSGKSLRFYGKLSNGDMIIALPEFSDGIQYLTIDFYYMTKTYNTMSVGYISDLNNKATYTAVKELSTSTNSWTNISQSFSSAPSGAYIAFKFAGTSSGSSSSSNGALYIEDVLVTTSYVEPVGSCAKPKNLTKSDDTPEGATFTWAQNADETTYQWACVVSGAEVTSWNTLDENVRTKVVTGLTAGTAYDFHVRSYCGAGEGEQSASAKSTFTPICPAPTAPVVSGISANGATLSWTGASGITDYQYIVVASGAAEDWTSPTLVEGAKNATLTNLTASTNYDVYVRSYYSENAQSTAVKASFMTACAAKAIPFEWDFSDLGCWTTKQCHPSSGISSGAFSFHYISNAPYDQYLISPEFDALSGTVDVQFDYRVYSATYFETFALGYSKTTSDIASFTWLSDETVNNTSYGDPYKKTLPAGVKYIAIRCTSEDKYALYIDNFSIVETPACPAPSITASNVIYNGATINCDGGGNENKWKLQYKATGDAEWTDANSGNLIAAASFDLTGLTPGTAYQAQAQAECEGAWSTAVSFTPNYVAPTAFQLDTKNANSATISWTANSGESSWTVQYKKASDGDWTTVSGVTANPYTITDLTSATTYQVRVAAGTLYTSALSFTTDCEAKVALGYTEGFEDFTTGNTASTGLLCWDELNASHSNYSYPQMYVSTNSTYIQSGSKSLYFVSSDSKYIYAILPELTGSYEGLQLVFSHKEESETRSGHFTLGYMTNVADANTFTAITTTAYTRAQSWNTETEDISAVPTGARLAFRYGGASNNYYAGIDDIRIEEKPSCTPPTAVVADAITNNSASISWEKGDEENSWKLQYSQDGETWTAANDGNAVTRPFVLNELAANTTYYVQVKAVCESSESPWSASGEFTTDCDAVNMPLTQAFASALPECWKLNTVGGNEWMPSSSQRVSASYSMQYSAYTAAANYADLISPSVILAEDANLTFQLRNYSYNAAVTGEVYIAVGSTMTKLLDLPETTTWEQKTIDLSEYTGETVKFIFRGHGNGESSYSYLYIDDVEVKAKPCDAPTALNVVASSHDAVVSWTDEAADKWNLRWHEVGASSWNEENGLTDKTYTISTGLELEKTYEVQVQAVCTATKNSEWTSLEEFALICTAPSALAVTARTQTSATLAWISSESAWNLLYSSDSENWTSVENITANPYTLEGLNAGTTYQVKIQSVCGSEYTSAVEFTTWCGLKEATELPLNIESFTAVPECWEINFVGENSGIANGKIFFYGEEEQWAILPAYDIELNKLSVTFGFSTSYADLTVGYIDEPNGEFHAFASQPTTGVELNLENEAEAVKYIAIRYIGTSTYASGSISSVQLRKTPTCAKPTDLVVTPNVGTAMINWNSEATAWNLQYKPASAANWTDAEVTAKPFELTGLAQGASYKVRVQANCGEELSDWSDEMLFSTSCEAIATIPFVESFDTELSSCWNITDDETNHYAHSVYDGTLRLPGGKVASGHLVVLPEISASLEKAVMTIEYTAATGANTATPQVGYMDGESFVELALLSKSGSTTEARIELATANGHRLALRYDDGTSEGDFNITEIRVINQAVLEDSENNEAALGAILGETVDITINRTLTEGYFNTLCLPFDLATLEGTPLAGSELWGFKYGNVENGELLIRIIEQDELKAGVPYLIKVPATVTNPTFKGVTIQEKTGKSVGQTEEVQFIGILKPEAFTISGDDVHKKLFLLPNDQLAWANTENNLKSFRAYFLTTENISGTPVAGMPARIVKEKNEATGCETVQGEHQQSLKVLENNQVVIIRNGVRYNLQGQKIQ